MSAQFVYAEPRMRAQSRWSQLLARACRALAAAGCLLMLVFAASAAHSADGKNAGSAAAPWTLDANNSELSFVTVKASDIAEAHTIAELSGGVTPGASAGASGELNLNIHLDSVNTNIPIRDERIREHLFNTAKHPLASVHGHLPIASYLQLEVGDSTSAELNLMLDLKATRLPITAKVLVSRLGTNRFMVTSSKAVIINAASVGLVAGIDKLQQLASLPSISKAVPVSFVLTFVR